MKFRGGKGVATGLGAFLLLAPYAVLVAVAVFLTVVAIFRHVSLGSIIAVALVPLLAWFLDGEGNQPAILVCMTAACGLIIAKHHENIRRLLAGSENRFRTEAQGIMSRIAIIGAGAWGTGISVVLGRKGTHRVRLWAHEKRSPRVDCAAACERTLSSRPMIPDCVTASAGLEEALRDAEIVVSAMPSQHVRRLFQSMRPHLKPEAPIVSATKGLEETALLRMTEVISQTIAVGRRLSAPRGCAQRAYVRQGSSSRRSHRDHHRVARQRSGRDCPARIRRPGFRVYTNDDVIGVELGGALKNIIAIAAGVCHGLGLGHNSIAALITRGLAEMTRLVVACGGRQETMAGLAGLGDLVLTCTGGLSRNRGVGVELGRGHKLPEILAGMHGSVAEGVFTTHAAVGLAGARGVEMPITEQMYADPPRWKAAARRHSRLDDAQREERTLGARMRRSVMNYCGLNSGKVAQNRSLFGFWIQYSVS